ncbi:MAG: hypothetical protein K2W82_15670 [Candidatus Obscuribacterales bacterium]|nr:hypothetical protein [Candidatus Obscuribacterales bacterium]
MNKVQIPTPRERETHLDFQRHRNSHDVAVEHLLERCRAVLLGPEPDDGKLTVSLFSEPEAVVTEVISILGESNWLAQELDNGKGEGFTNLVLTSMPFPI